MKASILAIGTELTSGQILNRNAHWIANKLTEFGVPCSIHLAVPDQNDLILRALDFLAKDSELIFLTGGLGPTTDDLTRDVLGQWTNLELIFDEKSWQHLNAQLAKRGLQAKELHRQECYFPKNAEVFTNSVGTANAFYCEANAKKIFVLPGPPKEIDAIWTDSIHEKMTTLTKNLDRTITKKWQTTGKGESEIASLVLPETKDCPFIIGYRVHLPFVEVKISHLSSETESAQIWIDRIDNVLKPFCVL